MHSLNSVFLSIKLPSLIKIFFLIDLGLCIAYAVNYLAGQSYSKLTSLLNLDGEASLAAWYSSVQLFCIFIFSAVFSYHKIDRTKKSYLLIGLPVIFLLMSIDETVQIHEWLGEKSDFLLPGGSRNGTVFQETGIWMFLFGLPFLALFLIWVYVIREYLADKPASFIKLITGMMILLAGALGIELLSNFSVEANHYVTEVIFEEGLEMIGATVILWAVYEMAIEYIPGLVQDNT